MGNELIREIVQLEEELRVRVAAAEQEAQAWLETLRAELAASGEARRRALQEERVAALAAARATAKAAAAEQLRRAQEVAQRLAALDDEALRPLILGKLTAILPPRDHDHPDVEG